MSALVLVTVAKPADSSEPGASSREAEDATMRAGDSGGRLCYRRMNRERIGRMMTALQFCGMRLGNLVASPFRYDLAYDERGCGSVLATSSNCLHVVENASGSPSSSPKTSFDPDTDR